MPEKTVLLNEVAEEFDCLPNLEIVGTKPKAGVSAMLKFSIILPLTGDHEFEDIEVIILVCKDGKCVAEIVVGGPNDLTRISSQFFRLAIPVSMLFAEPQLEIWEYLLGRSITYRCGNKVQIDLLPEDRVEFCLNIAAGGGMNLAGHTNLEQVRDFFEFEIED
jgi:hypothetical protein